jgi:hypothetical protein
MIVVASGYSAYALYPLLAGPEFDASVSEYNEGIVIAGTVKRVASVWVNDLPVPITDQGLFSIFRAYPPGYTEIVVRVADRFGRSREKRLTVVINEFIPYAEKDNQTNQQESSGNEPEGNEG